MIEPRRITIVGGGLVGPVFACMAADLGHTVTLIERRADPRLAGHLGGRSINLALSERGLEALSRIGLEAAVRDIVIPMPGRMIHDEHGRTAFQPYSVIPGEAILSVSRGELNTLLLEAAQQRPDVSVVFDATCCEVSLDSASVTLEDGRVFEGDLIVGADGAGSAVRAAMHDVDGVDDGTDFIESRYRELCIPAGPQGAWRIEPHALHIWPRGSSMMIALPNLDGSFTVTCFWPEEAFARLGTPDEIIEHFTAQYPDAVELMPTLVEDFQANPSGLLGTVRCRRFFYGATAVLIGDAAHAIVPFFGQGMNAGFQGASRLARAMEEFDDIATAVAGYDAMMRPDAAAIADLALQNYVEMRSHTASWFWRLKTRVQKRLNRMFPRAYQPLYNMVSFSTIPYAEAVAIVNRRHRRAAFVGGMLTVAVVLAVLWGTGTID